MGSYYVAFCQIYSIFLLTIYFEFFADTLATTLAVERRVQQMRITLVKQNRWPEMLTFEEVNLDVPKGNWIMRIVLQITCADDFKDGFIAGADRAKAGKAAASKPSS